MDKELFYFTYCFFIIVFCVEDRFLCPIKSVPVHCVTVLLLTVTFNLSSHSLSVFQKGKGRCISVDKVSCSLQFYGTIKTFVCFTTTSRDQLTDGCSWFI